MIKVNKRLAIRCTLTGQTVYTPPDFLRHLIRNRDGMRALAARFDAGDRPIKDIIDFESGLRP